MPEVYWYSLRRATPKFDSVQKDNWSTPGESSCEAALVYLEKEACPGSRLEQCRDDDGVAEFYIEKRQRLVSDFGASRSIQPGALIDSCPVRRVPV
jgi:hypothetical protein